MSSLLLLVGILVSVISFALLIRLYFKFRRAEGDDKQMTQGQFSSISACFFFPCL